MKIKVLIWKKNYLSATHFFISVGKPISVLKTDQPTQEQIDSTHKAYVQALKELYEEYNPIYGDPSINLNFIWIVQNPRST